MNASFDTSRAATRTCFKVTTKIGGAYGIKGTFVIIPSKPQYFDVRLLSGFYTPQRSVHRQPNDVNTRKSALSYQL